MLSLIFGSTWRDGFWWGLGAGLVLLVLAGIGVFAWLETRRLY